MVNKSSYIFLTSLQNIALPSTQTEAWIAHAFPLQRSSNIERLERGEVMEEPSTQSLKSVLK